MLTLRNLKMKLRNTTMILLPDYLFTPLATSMQVWMLTGTSRHFPILFQHPEGIGPGVTENFHIKNKILLKLYLYQQKHNRFFRQNLRKA